MSTKSSNPIVFGVDLDGVCGDYTAAFRPVAAEALGVPERDLADDHDWGFSQWGLDKDSFIEMHERAVVEHRIFRDMQMIDGASEVLQKLSTEGVYIRVVTHRLILPGTHKLVVSDTVDWLDRNEIPYSDICFAGDKADIQCDVFVDDAPHNIEALRAAGIPTVIFSHGYNSHIGGRRVNSWHQLYDLVSQYASMFEGLK